MKQAWKPRAGLNQEAHSNDKCVKWEPKNQNFGLGFDYKEVYRFWTRARPLTN